MATAAAATTGVGTKPTLLDVTTTASAPASKPCFAILFILFFRTFEDTTAATAAIACTTGAE